MSNTDKCSVSGCSAAVLARGWCNAHYKRWWRNGTPLGAAIEPCRECGAEFTPDHHSERYCSDGCRESAFTRQRAAVLRRSLMKSLYGLSSDEFDALLQAQGNRCAICRSETPSGRGGWHIDHDHTTGRVRGLLCHYCNTGLGSFRDSPDLLREAAIYLEGDAA